MKAYVLIDIHTGEISEAVKQIDRVEGVVEANMVFGIYDAIAVVEADDVNAIGRIITTSIQPIPGVIDTVTCLAVES